MPLHSLASTRNREFGNEARPELESTSRPRRGAASPSQGHPRTIFRRALEHDNLVLAEVTAREIGQTDRGLERPWNFGPRSGIVT